MSDKDSEAALRAALAALYSGRRTSPYMRDVHLTIDRAITELVGLRSECEQLRKQWLNHSCGHTHPEDL